MCARRGDGGRAYVQRAQPAPEPVGEVRGGDDDDRLERAVDAQHDADLREVEAVHVAQVPARPGQGGVHPGMRACGHAAQ